MQKPKIVIVGGGFGGLKSALVLAESQSYDITIISDHADFRYYPVLFHTAAGGKKVLSSIPLKDLFADKKINIIQDRVVGLDRSKKQIFTENQRGFEYDKVILALGVKTNYFGIKGLEEYSYGIKSNSEAMRLKKHLHKILIEKHKLDQNYIVVGGGPTGVELAGALPTYLRRIAELHGIGKPRIHVDLVEASPRLLPRLPKDVSAIVKRHLKKMGVKIYLNTAVRAESADALMINNQRVSTHTVVWTAGVTNHDFFNNQGFQETTSGKVRVNQYLEAESDIFVIGDNADTPYSGMAQTAIHDGNFVAKNLIRIANNKDPKPYRARRPITVIPVGDFWAAVCWGPIRMYGWLGWALRRSSDLIGYHDYQPWTRASQLWLKDHGHEDVCTICDDANL